MLNWCAGLNSYRKIAMSSNSW